MWGFRSRSSGTALVVTDGDDGATRNFPLVAANLSRPPRVRLVMGFRALAVGAAVVAAPNPIATENARPGTTDWDFTSTAGHVVEGYSSETSAAPGSAFHLHVSAGGRPGDRYRVNVYRLGWYGGKGGRLVA